MKIPLKWLQEYVDVKIPPAALIERLTISGLEVASTRVYGMQIPDGVRVKADEVGPVWDRDKIVSAKVLKVDKHPNADKLKLVTVEYGTQQPKVVVTGAPNINVGDTGQIVILALVGSVLFDGHATPKKLSELKPTQLRGVPSDAMVCSGFELGTTDDHEGIIVLPADTPVGKPLADLMGDIVVDIDILPNMARCLGMLGVAREVAAITGGLVRIPEARFASTGKAIDGRARVAIADPKLSARYTATLIEGITVRDSPLWMQTRLTYAAMRPINNLVDVTNYVMLEWGQPLHAFDYDVLLKRSRGGAPTITVRPAALGEKLVTLDKIERKLSPETLVIADDLGPIALAGVMGGLETEVTPQTKNVLLESANFDFVSIRRTAKALDLPSEASYRFSRGIHPEIVKSAAMRAAALLADLGGGRVADGMVDCYPRPVAPHVINLELREIRRLLGIDIPVDEVKRILTALDFQVEARGDSSIRVVAPVHRVDIQDGPTDLVEEIARIHGYDRLPATLLADSLPAQHGNAELTFEERLRDLMTGYGLQEFITYSLTTKDREAPLTPPNCEYIKLLNPITSERDSLRHTILAGLLDCTAANLRHSNSVLCFEIGPVFFGQTAGKLPDEQSRLGIVMTGSLTEPTWSGTPSADAEFFDLKGVIESLIKDLQIAGATFAPSSANHLHPGKSADLVLRGESVGAFGELHPKVVQSFDVARRKVLVAEFDVAKLRSAAAGRFQYRPVPRFPAALRDVAVIVTEDIPAQTVATEIRAGGGELLDDLRLFDVYRGASIPTGTKSLAFALTYLAPDRTLTDKEVDKAHKKIEDRLKHVLKAGIRGKD